MSDSASQGAVQEILREHIDVEVPSPDYDLIENAAIDSLAVVELVFQLEQRFALTINLEQLDLEDLRSVRRIARFVDACLAAQPASQDAR